MADPRRLERLTYCLEGSCSILLSYGSLIRNVSFIEDCLTITRIIAIFYKIVKQKLNILFFMLLLSPLYMLICYRTKLLIKTPIYLNFIIFLDCYAVISYFLKLILLSVPCSSLLIFSLCL